LSSVRIDDVHIDSSDDDESDIKLVTSIARHEAPVKHVDRASKEIASSKAVVVGEEDTERSTTSAKQISTLLQSQKVLTH
jgi:hypothetical protein